MDLHITKFPESWITVFSVLCKFVIGSFYCNIKLLMYLKYSIVFILLGIIIINTLFSIISIIMSLFLISIPQGIILLLKINVNLFKRILDKFFTFLINFMTYFSAYLIDVSLFQLGLLLIVFIYKSLHIRSF